MFFAYFAVPCRLRFGKMVDKVIPYLPMDPASNLLVIELKLQKLGETLAGGLYTTSGESHGLCQRGWGLLDVSACGVAPPTVIALCDFCCTVVVYLEGKYLCSLVSSSSCASLRYAP